MTAPLNTLIIEDDPDDAALIERVLRRAGFDVHAARVESAETTFDALRSGRWDVVLADFTLPGFRGVEALGMLIELDLDIPFIIISGTIDAATALEAMRAGAADYVLKAEIERLPAVIERETDAAHTRRERRLAEAERDQALVDLKAANDELKALALENSRLYAAEHRIAETLQEAILALPRDVPSLDYFMRYISATEHARVGGDFYDLFQIDDRTVGVVVGDVSGKGLEAASLSAMVRNVIRSAALDRRTAAGVIAKTNLVVERFTESETFVTAFFGTIDTETGELRYVGAGHPPVMLRRADGTTEVMPSSSPLIGAFSDADYTEAGLFLEAGDTLFLFTDGLTEARSPEREFYGEERVVDVLTRIAGELGPKSVVEAVFNDVTLFAGSRPTDDMALVAVRLAL